MKSIAFASLINEKFLETCDFVSFCHPTFLSEFSYCGGRKLKKYYIVVSQDSPFFLGQVNMSVFGDILYCRVGGR